MDRFKRRLGTVAIFAVLMVAALIGAKIGDDIARSYECGCAVGWITQDYE